MTVSHSAVFSSSEVTKRHCMYLDLPYVCVKSVEGYWKQLLL